MASVFPFPDKSIARLGGDVGALLAHACSFEVLRYLNKAEKMEEQKRPGKAAALVIITDS